MTIFARSLVPLLLFGLVLIGCDSGGGAGPESLGDSTAVQFSAADAAVDETAGSYSIEFVAGDPGFKEFRFDVTVDQSQSTVTLGEDIRGLSADTTVSFPASTTDGETQSLPIEVIDEPIDSTGFLEGTETLVLTISAPDTAQTSIGEISTFTLTINEEDTPLTVQEARDRPSGGRAVTDATVTRVESDGFYLQDDTGGLFVFDSDYATQVSRGDQVRVDGSAGFFNGLFQLSGVGDAPLTEVLSSGNPPPPQSVSLLEIVTNGEEYESELVRVAFSIDDKGNSTFQGGPPEGLYPISTEDTSSTLLITGGSELVGQEIPDRALFQGVVGQFNGAGFGADEPDEGYQLLGLQTGDVQSFETLLSVNFDDGTLPPMMTFSVASNNDWQPGNPPADNAPVAEANGFGGNEPANDWLITPALDFSSFEVETLTFLSAKGFDDSEIRGLQVKVSTDYSGSGDPTNATWVDVSDRVRFARDSDKPDGSSFTPFINSGQVDLSDTQFQDAEVYVAFQYRSSGTGAGSAAQWQVDNITVSGVPMN